MNDQSISLVTDALGPLLRSTITGTIPLTIISFVLGLLLALLVALMRISSIPFVSPVARAGRCMMKTPSEPNFPRMSWNTKM